MNNVKYLDATGEYEVVICFPKNSDPYIVKNSVNRGTRNLGTESAFQHLGDDMLPYYAFGNSGWGPLGDIVGDLFGWL